jgi:hypothetical protein
VVKYAAMVKNEEKIKELEQKLKGYEKKLAEKSLGYGSVVRTRFGDPYEEQLREDTNVLRSMIQSIKDEIEKLKK